MKCLLSPNRALILAIRGKSYQTLTNLCKIILSEPLEYRALLHGYRPSSKMAVVPGRVLMIQASPLDDGLSEIDESATPRVRLTPFPEAAPLPNRNSP